MKVKFKNAKILISLTLTVTMLLVSTCTFSLATTAMPKIYLEPSNNIYTIDTAYVGMKFNVTVWCADIPVDIAGAQITLHFNDTILNVTAWYVPSLSDQNFFYYGATKITALPDPPDPGYVHVDAGHGYIKVAVLNGYLPPKAPWGHNGTIAIIEFNITAAPTEQGKYSSTLGINNDDTYIKDTSNVNIDVTKQDGYYEIRKPGPVYSLTISTTSGGTTDPVPGIWTYESGTIVPVTAIPATNYILDHWELDNSWNYSNPINVIMNSNHALHAVFVFSPPKGSRIFVDPPETVIPDAVPCQTNFNINVSIDDIAEMKTCEFNLTYNTNIISVIGLNFLSINGQYPTLDLIANDTAGFVWMKLAYSTPITVSSPTPLTTLTFHVDNLGATPLNLTNTKIMDTYDNPIPHDVYDGFFMAAIRNVAVTDITLSRTWAYPGWPINVTVTVKNKGTVAESFNVHAYYDSHVIGTITVTDLTPGEERSIIFEWSTIGVPEGNYTIKAEAEPVPYELDTTDNTLIDGKVWIMTHFHDVAIVSVTSESWAFQGWTVHINVTARNNGEFTESFDINAYCNTTLIGMVHVTNLPPGNEYKAQFSLNTSTLLQCHTYPIKGEATLVPFEYNETNNIMVSTGFKVRLFGDLNGDGKVDLDDVLIVSLAFGSYPGARNWNPDADTNRDNKIDLTDVLNIYINYGKTC
jgi:hypothetical protein